MDVGNDFDDDRRKLIPRWSRVAEATGRAFDNSLGGEE
jgi:hypothetical protein